MKKILTGILLTIALLTALVCPALAAADNNDAWVLAADAAYITHGDKTYWPMEFAHTSFLDRDEWEYYDLSFADKETEKVYDGSYVEVVSDAENIAVQVTIYKNAEYHTPILYVEDSHQEEFLQIKNGDPAGYVTYNDTFDVSLPVDKSQYDAWCNDSATQMSTYAVRMTARDVGDFGWYYIYGRDSRDVFRYECGLVLRDMATDELYLLRYDDYDRTYFYRDGEFAADHDDEVTVYKLRNEALRQQLIEFYDTQPEEELDWLVEEETSFAVTGVIAGLFFGFLPLAVVAFAVIMLIRVKERAYRIPFILLLASAAAVFASFVVLFIYLK